MTRRASAPPPAPGAAAQVAVIGCGHWGKNLVRNYYELGALAAVADDDPETATTHSRSTGVPVLTFEEILARSEIAGVAIATPAEFHARLALQALEAGKHVFVEKPLALTVEDAERLIECAAEADRVLMVGHLLRYHPAFLRLQELVRSGRLGRLQYLYSNRLNLGKIRREENVVWSFAPHDISMILALVASCRIRFRQSVCRIYTASSRTSPRRMSASRAGSTPTSLFPGCIRSKSRSWWLSAMPAWQCSMTDAPGPRS